MAISSVVILLLGLSAQAREGGTSVGGSGSGSIYSAYVSEWCRGNQALLSQYLTQARLADLKQDTSGVVDLLMKGLNEALAHPLQGSVQSPVQGPTPGPAAADKSLTYLVITRGIELAEALRSQSQVDSHSMEATRAFLMRYYRFIDSVANSIDVSLYIPYQYQYSSCRDCKGFDDVAFERRYIEYAEAQIGWFLETFVTEDSNQILPRYSAKSALKVLEYLTQYVADDLARSLWAAKFACVIQKLALLNHNLAAHNSGNRAFYDNDRYALNIATEQVKALRESILNGCTK